MKENRIRPIVLGIFLHEDRLLVFEVEDPVRGIALYRPLGGAIEFGEHSRDAFIREMREELDTEVTDIRYLGLLESIFTHRGKRGHEIVLLYAGRLADPTIYARQSWMGEDDGGAMEILWKPLADFKNGDLLVPTGLLSTLEQDASPA